jgi:hypothetical protein
MPDNQESRPFPFAGRTGEIEAVTARHDLGPPPAKVFSEEELFRGLALAHPEREARDLARAIVQDLAKPGTVWARDNVLLIALLSPEHRRRAAEFLGLAPDVMEHELTRVKNHLVRPRA